MTPETLTLDDLTLALNLSKASVYRLIKKGLLRRCPGIRAVRVPRVSLDEYLENSVRLALPVYAPAQGVQQKRVQDQSRGPGRGGQSQKRVKKGFEGQDQNRHGLFGVGK